MFEIKKFEKFHSRAVKLLRKQKPFVVVACDEPYYWQVYGIIRQNEKSKGTWSYQDERIYLEQLGKISQ